MFKSIKFKISLAVRNTYSFIHYLFIYLSEEIRREGGRKEGERRDGREKGRKGRENLPFTHSLSKCPQLLGPKDKSEQPNPGLSHGCQEHKNLGPLLS